MTPPAAQHPLTVLPLHPTHYELLGLPENASPAAVAQAAAALDLGASAERRLAAAVLSDPLRRGVYDRYLARERAVLAARQRPWLRRLWPTTLAARLLLVGTATGLLWAGWWFWTQG